MEKQKQIRTNNGNEKKIVCSPKGAEQNSIDL